MRTFIFGYYNKNNIGDEQYKLSVVKFLTTSKIFSEITSIEFMGDIEFAKYIPDKNDLLIIGGGDVLNNYFIDKLNNKLSSKLKNKQKPKMKQINLI